MKFSTFIEVFVAALYNETQVRKEREFSVGEIMDRYGLNFEAGWMENFFQDSTLSYRVESRRHMGPVRQQRVSLSAEGFRWAEDELGENVASFLEAHGARYIEAAAPEPTGLIESKSWTGLPSAFELSEERRESLTKLLIDAELALDAAGVGNMEKSMARAYIIAAKTLAEAPDPPVDLIWELVNRASALAGIASLFVSILALFTAASQ